MCSAAATIGCVGCVYDDDTPPARRLHIDVIDSDAGSTDDPQPLAGSYHVGVKTGLAANNDHLVGADAVDQIVLAEAVDYVNLSLFSKQGFAGSSDRIADQDSQIAFSLPLAA